MNHEKRHAFVKMVNRHDALAAKEGMEKSQDPDISAKARQVIITKPSITKPAANSGRPDGALGLDPATVVTTIPESVLFPSTD